MQSHVSPRVFLLVLLAAASCSKKEPPSPPSTTVAPSTPPAAVASTAASAPASSAAPVVTIPAGSLTAGTSCVDHPRVSNEEMEGEAIAMTEFDIDVYPYPNDPATPPKTNVTQAEAKALCEARGRRLCTELEWERACKGPQNTMYEKGNRYDPKACPDGQGGPKAPNTSESCKSAFGAAAMHGFVWEWTSSDWGRGKDPPQGAIATRGGFGPVPYVNMRCANGAGRAPDKKGPNMGFRCCGGKANAAEVHIGEWDADKAVLEPEPSITPDLSKLLKGALAGQLKPEPGYEYAVKRVWHWRPLPHEELLVAEYEGRAAERPSFVIPVVYQTCPKLTRAISRLKGPVDTMDEPVAGTPPTSVTIKIGGAGQQGDLKFKYIFGQVQVEQPDWVKAGGAPAASASGSAAAAPSAATSK
jgi:formylglycine-generating enzyme